MSPSGDDAYQRKLAAKQQQREAIEADRAAITSDFVLKHGQQAIVRFLEQGPDMVFADVHRLPMISKSGGRYARDLICLDVLDDGTPCPACQSPNKDLAKRGTKGFLNIIWRNAPVFQRDDQNKLVKDAGGGLIVVGVEDQIALWKCSWTVFSMLKAKDAKFKGLMSRDWEVTREGSTMNDTKWFVEPADPTVLSQPMTIADLALAEKKYDLKAITRPRGFQEMVQAITRGAIAGQGPQPTFDRSQYAPGAPTAESTFSDDAPRVQASAFQRG